MNILECQLTNNFNAWQYWSSAYSSGQTGLTNVNLSLKYIDGTVSTTCYSGTRFYTTLTTGDRDKLYIGYSETPFTVNDYEPVTNSDIPEVESASKVVWGGYDNATNRSYMDVTWNYNIVATYSCTVNVFDITIPTKATSGSSFKEALCFRIRTEPVAFQAGESKTISFTFRYYN